MRVLQVSAAPGPMNYHLNQQGQTVGVFPLEELCRRRTAGELTGTEFVWCEGMAEWQPLDAVLQREMPGVVPSPPPLPPPTPIPKSASKKPFPALIVVIVVLAVLAAFALFGIIGMRVARTLRPVLEAAARSERPRRRTSALAEASKPVQWTTNTLTAKQILERQKEFRIRQYVEGYEKDSVHDPAYDAEARQLIKTWIDFYYSAQTQTDRTAMVEACRRLAANPACDDPLLLTVIGNNSDELQEGVRLLDLAVNGYERSRYKAYPRFWAQVTLAGKLVDLHRDAGRVRKLDDSSIQLLKETLQDGSIRPEDQAEFAEILIDGWGRGFLNHNGAAVISAVKAAGKPYQWLAFVLEGQHEVNEAWKARGNGYANTVTPAGWKGFREHLAKARENFVKAWSLRPDLTEAPYRMVDVALGDSGIEEMRLWFDRTVTAQIDHFGAWRGLRWGLRPRWHGDLDSMLAFGIMAANTRRYDTDVPRKLLDSIADLESELKLQPGEHIYGREDVWPHLQKMYEGYIAEPSQTKERDGWRTSYAIVAYLAGKYDVARAQLEAINWQPRRQNLPGWGRDLSLMSLEVAARTGALGQQIDKAESRRNEGDIAGSLRIYTEVDGATNIDERTRAFVRDRLTTVQMEQRLQTGEWIDFLPTGEDLPGWTVERGKCVVLPDGALEVQSDPGGHIVFSRARVGADFEVRGNFEVVQSSTKSFQAGLVMGLPQFESTAWCGFRMKRNADEGDVASFAQGWTTRQLVQSAGLNSDTNSFYFRFHNGVVTATVNDKQIFKSAKPPEYVTVPTSDSHLGLGAYNDTNETIIRYRDVQVRKLTSR